MTILVSNANGKAGGEVALALIAAGEKVRIGARDVAAAQARFPSAEIVPFDVTKPETLAAAVQGVRAVLSALPYEVLPAGETALIDAARAAGVRRFVKVSAMGVDANPSSPHMVAEAALARSGLEWTVLRPNFFMQNYSQLSAAAVRAGTLHEPADNGASSFVDVRDIADVTVAALLQDGHQGRIYTLTGPAALTRGEIAAILSNVVGHPVAYVAVDDAALRAAMKGAAPTLIELMSALYGFVRAGWTATVTRDVEDVLGRPARSFETFARDHAAAWRDAA